MKVASPNTSVEICESVSLLTLDIILRCAFSHQSNCQDSGFVDNSVLMSPSALNLQATIAIHQISIHIIKNTNTEITVSSTRFYHMY